MADVAKEDQVNFTIEIRKFELRFTSLVLTDNAFYLCIQLKRTTCHLGDS